MNALPHWKRQRQDSMAGVITKSSIANTLSRCWGVRDIFPNINLKHKKAFRRDLILHTLWKAYYYASIFRLCRRRYDFVGVPEKEKTKEESSWQVTFLGIKHALFPTGPSVWGMPSFSQAARHSEAEFKIDYRSLNNSWNTSEILLHYRPSNDIINHKRKPIDQRKGAILLHVQGFLCWGIECVLRFGLFTGAGT